MGKVFICQTDLQNAIRIRYELVTNDILFDMHCAKGRVIFEFDHLPVRKFGKLYELFEKVMLENETMTE